MASTTPVKQSPMTRSASKKGPAATPPPPPLPEVVAEEQTIKPEPASPSFAEEQTISLCDTATSFITLEHKFAAPLYGVINMGFVAMWYTDCSLVNVVSWGLLLALLKGFVSAAFAPKTAPAALTVLDLEPALPALAKAASIVRALHHDVLESGDAAKTLGAALGLYALAALSARLSTLTLLFVALNAPVGVALAAKHGKSSPHAARARAAAEELAGAACARVRAAIAAQPEYKAALFLLPLAALALWVHLALSTKVLALAYGAMGYKAYLARTDPAAASKAVAVDLAGLKRKARRMSVSARDMLFTKQA